MRFLRPRTAMIGAVLVAALLVPSLGRTGEFAGACSLAFRMNFSPSLILTEGGTVGWSIPETSPVPGRDGTCTHTGLGITYVYIEGSGSGLSMSCEALNLNGSAKLTFDDTLPSVSGASVSLTGSVQSAEMTLLRPGTLGQTVIGVASLMGTANCLGDELTSAQFSGSLLVIDP